MGGVTEQFSATVEATHGVMTKWKVLVVDDDAPAQRTLKAFLEQLTNVEVVGECSDVGAAVREIRTHQPDILFVDVTMPGALTLDMLHIPGLETIPLIVFTTAVAEQAMLTKDAHAFDYLLKPLSHDRFTAVMGRVKAALERAHPVVFSHAPRVMTTRDATHTVAIPVPEIDWIEAEDYCTRVHAGRRKPLVRRSIQSLLEELAGDGFMRASRTTIVNLARIREFRPLQKGEAEVAMTSGAMVPVSRSYRVQIEHRVQTRQQTKPHKR